MHPLHPPVFAPANKVTRGPHYDADATIADLNLLETDFTSYFRRKVSWITCKPFLALSKFLLISSSRLSNFFHSPAEHLNTGE